MYTIASWFNRATKRASLYAAFRLGDGCVRSTPLPVGLPYEFSALAIRRRQNPSPCGNDDDRPSLDVLRALSGKRTVLEKGEWEHQMRLHLPMLRHTSNFTLEI